MKAGLLLVSLALFFAGCAQPYIPPTSGDIAQVRFPEKHVAVQFFADERCSNARLLGEQRTVNVPAGTPLYVGMTFENTGYRQICTVYFSFVPATDTLYVVEYYEPDMGRCAALVDRTSPDGVRLGKEPSAKAFKGGFTC